MLKIEQVEKIVYRVDGQDFDDPQEARNWLTNKRLRDLICPPEDAHTRNLDMGAIWLLVRKAPEAIAILQEHVQASEEKD